jgi:hypothetical protein
MFAGLTVLGAYAIFSRLLPTRPPLSEGPGNSPWTQAWMLEWNHQDQAGDQD